MNIDYSLCKISILRTKFDFVLKSYLKNNKYYTYSTNSHTAMLSNEYYQSVQGFIHTRPLGDKFPGSHLYKNVSWSDVAIQGIPAETIRYLRDADDYNDHRRKCALLKSVLKGGDSVDFYEGKGGSERYGDDFRSYTGKGPAFKSYKGNEYEWRDGRKRKIVKVHKKYPTKPKNHAKIHRNKYYKHTQ